MNTVGEFVRRLRDERSVSLHHLAAQASVSQRTLSYWEAGTYQPRLPELESVLSALGATAEQHAQALALLTAPRGVKELRLSPEHLRQSNDLGLLPSGGDLLRTLRLRRGLPLEQVAALMGVSGATVSRWETGKVIPPPDRMDALLTALGAREPERAALKDGYLFLMAPQAETVQSASDLQDSFRAFSFSLYGNREDKLNDLRFLSFEAQAWSLAAKSERGRTLLAAVCANYAAFLSGFNRLDEAYRYAYRTLDLLAYDSGSEETLLRAAIIAARAETFRGIRPVPKRGIKMLDSWRSAASLPEFQAWMLSDMAEYLLLEGKEETALRLRREACSMAERCQNPDELRLRKIDLAKAEVHSGNAEHALSLVALSARDSPFRRADIELLFAEGLTALNERRNAEVWLERANADIAAYDFTHLHNRAAGIANQF